MLKKLNGLKKLVIWIIDMIFWIVPGPLIVFLIKPTDLGSFVLCFSLCYFTGFLVGYAEVFYKKYKLKNSSSEKTGLQLTFLTYMIPKKFRDEFLGDFLEQRLKMKEEKQPNWYINLVSCGQIFLVVVAMLKIRLWDWVDPEKENNK